jgi:hypothetical protein
MTDALEQELRGALAERAAGMPEATDALARLSQTDFRSRDFRARAAGLGSWLPARLTARLPLWPALGGAVAALGGVIAAAVVLLSSGAAPAYAGWTPVPTTPTSSALAAATRSCNWMFNARGPAVLKGKPVLTDARGRYTAQIYVTKTDVRFCVSDGRRGGTGGGSAPGLLWFYAPPGPDQLGLSDNGGGGARGFGTRNPNVYGVVRHAFGLAGRNVRAVSFSFAGGSVVRATVQHGWYFAWWPNMNYPTSVTVTTTSGTIRSPMEPTGGQGPGCRFGARGCVWAGIRKHPLPPTRKSP